MEKCPFRVKDCTKEDPCAACERDKLTDLRQQNERLVGLLEEANKVLENHPEALYPCNKGEYILALSKRITAELNHARGQVGEGDAKGLL